MAIIITSITARLIGAARRGRAKLGLADLAGPNKAMRFRHFRTLVSPWASSEKKNKIEMEFQC